MLKTIAVGTASLALLLSAGAASAQKIDANGRCHDAAGKFAKAEVCGGAARSASSAAKPATAKVAAAPAAAAPPAKGAKCKDAKGKFAKCGSPGAHPA